MHPTLVGRVRRCKRRVNWFNSNWMLHLVAKPDKRAGLAPKAKCAERRGVQVLWLSPYVKGSRAAPSTVWKTVGPLKRMEFDTSSHRHRQEDSESIELQRVGTILGWVKFPRRTFIEEQCNGSTSDSDSFSLGSSPSFSASPDSNRVSGAISLLSVCARIIL